MTSFRPSRRILLPLLALAAGTELLAQRANVFPPARRVPTVEQATAIANRPTPDALGEDLNNPFFPNSLKTAEVTPADANPTPTNATAPVPTGPSNDYELLETIAPEITPSGTMSMGGEPLLLFGQKKIRIGDQLPVIYGGQRYILVISAIEPSSFTLRLGEAEYTRPIQTTN